MEYQIKKMMKIMMIMMEILMAVIIIKTEIVIKIVIILMIVKMIIIGKEKISNKKDKYKNGKNSILSNNMHFYFN